VAVATIVEIQTAIPQVEGIITTIITTTRNKRILDLEKEVGKEPTLLLSFLLHQL
jgi:hypothetical protein